MAEKKIYFLLIVGQDLPLPLPELNPKMSGGGGGIMAPLKPLYFDKSPNWPNLKILHYKEAICKGFESKNVMPDCLKPRRVTKNVDIWPNNMTLLTDEDLYSKNFRVKKIYILAKDIDSVRKLEIKAKKFRLEKGKFFGLP